MYIYKCMNVYVCVCMGLTCIPLCMHLGPNVVNVYAFVWAYMRWINMYYNVTTILLYLVANLYVNNVNRVTLGD